jgi:hypothetical protein
MNSPSPVYIEAGAKRSFACSLEWPGLCRSGRDEEAALSALLSYAARYAAVAERAGIGFGLTDEQPWAVVARVPTRSGGADFGVPTTVLDSDLADLELEEAGRTAALLSASWQFLDEVVATAPASLRKGPRGGGRDRDEIVGHVAAAEQMFAAKIGIKLRVPATGQAEAVLANRVALEDWCRGGQARPGARPGWPPRYAARRLIWHVLDHAWEIEDRRP